MIKKNLPQVPVRWVLLLASQFTALMFWWTWLFAIFNALTYTKLGMYVDRSIISDDLHCWLPSVVAKWPGSVMTLSSFGPITSWATQPPLTSFLRHACAKNATLFMRLCWWDFVLTGELSSVLVGHRGSACQSVLLSLIYGPPWSTMCLQWPKIIMIIITVSQGSDLLRYSMWRHHGLWHPCQCGLPEEGDDPQSAIKHRLGQSFHLPQWQWWSARDQCVLNCFRSYVCYTYLLIYLPCLSAHNNTQEKALNVFKMADRFILVTREWEADWSDQEPAVE